MRKFKLFWDFDAEEKYLNDMASKGYILKKYSMFGFYHFELSQPQKLNYKIDYRVFNDREEFENYIALFEDAGWKHVSGTKRSGVQYFLPMNEKAGTDIFSNRASAAMRYKTFYDICMVNFICFVFNLTVILLTTNGNLSNLTFLTPGLWVMTGKDFWSAFFFELPFVILRVLPLIAFAAAGVLYFYWGTKAKKLYNLRISEEKSN